MDESKNAEILVPDGLSIAETEIKKSRFIGYSCRCSSDREAKAIISGLWAEHKFARHIAYAFICGRPGSTLMGMSDDGEPKGTAGRPMLQVLKGSGLTDVLCAVIRYFGGIKLGTGGLVKAYTEAARLSLESLPRRAGAAEAVFTVTTGYEYYDNARRIIAAEKGCSVTGEDFLENVVITALVPEASLENIKRKLLDATSGKAFFPE